MKKLIPFFTIITIITVISSVFSFKIYNNIKEIEKNINYDEHIIKEFNEEMTDNENLINTNLENQKSSINILLEDKLFLIKDSNILLNGEDKVIIELPGLHNIQYDSSLDYFFVDENITIKAISSNEIINENISIFKNESNEEIICGQKKLTNNTGLSIIIKTTDKENDIKFIEEIINSAKLYNETTEISLFGYNINTTWYNNVLLTKDVISLTNNEDTIYISLFEEEIEGAGFDNELVINENLTIKYSDIKDSTTGFAPFLLTIDEYMIKILASDINIVKDLFVLS